jgi:hypothetical protein
MLGLPISDRHSAAALRQMGRAETRPRVGIRMLAIAALLDGLDRTGTARQFGMSRTVLRLWVTRYNQDGVAGLVDRWSGGPPPKLSDEEAVGRAASAAARHGGGRRRTRARRHRRVPGGRYLRDGRARVWCPLQPVWDAAPAARDRLLLVGAAATPPPGGCRRTGGLQTRICRQRSPPSPPCTPRPRASSWGSTACPRA